MARRNRNIEEIDPEVGDSRIHVQRNFRLYDEANPNSQRVKCRNFLSFLKLLGTDMIKEHKLFCQIREISFLRYRAMALGLYFILIMIIKAIMGINYYATVIPIVLYALVNGSYYFSRAKRNKWVQYITAIIGSILIIIQLITDGILDHDKIGSNITLMIIYLLLLYCHLQLDVGFAFPMEYPSAALVFLLFYIIYPVYYCIYKDELQEIERRREERRIRRIQMELEAPQRERERRLQRLPAPVEPADLSDEEEAHAAEVYNTPANQNNKYISQNTGFKFASQNTSQKFEERMKSAVITLCMICLEEFVRGERIAQLKCHKTHIFHSDCINAWKQKKNECPLCRANRPQVILKDFAVSQVVPPNKA